MNDAEQMLIISGVDLYKEVVFPRRMMTLHNLRNLFQRLCDRSILIRTLEKKPHVSTRLEPDLAIINDEFGAFHDSSMNQLLNPLMDSRPRNIALSRHLKKRLPSVFDHHAQNLLVQFI